MARVFLTKSRYAFVTKTQAHNLALTHFFLLLLWITCRH